MNFIMKCHKGIIGNYIKTRYKFRIFSEFEGVNVNDYQNYSKKGLVAEGISPRTDAAVIQM